MILNFHFDWSNYHWNGKACHRPKQCAENLNVLNAMSPHQATKFYGLRWLIRSPHLTCLGFSFCSLNSTHCNIWIRSWMGSQTESYPARSLIDRVQTTFQWSVLSLAAIYSLFPRSYIKSVCHEMSNIYFPYLHIVQICPFLNIQISITYKNVYYGTSAAWYLFWAVWMIFPSLWVVL